MRTRRTRSDHDASDDNVGSGETDPHPSEVTAERRTPSGAGGPSHRPRLRLPMHRGTTAHIVAAYPFSIDQGLGHEGEYLGTNLLAGHGGFVWDPFDAYSQGLTTNSNTWVLGEPGNGKSALIKGLLYRMAAVHGTGPDGRFIAIADPKGEYRPLAEALQIPIVRLEPGGSTRLNPLDAGPATDRASAEARIMRQSAMVRALTASVLGRALVPVEETAIWQAIETLERGDSSDAPSTLLDVASLLAGPTDQMAARAKLSTDDLADEARAVWYAIDKLITQSLRGMFDGPSNVAVDWAGRGVLLDLSAVHADTEALPLVMVAATAWLQELMATGPPRQRVQVLDEAWCLLAHRASAAYLQSCWKLGRNYGVANIAIAHRPSDLAAQADDGSSTAKIAAGLLADTATKIVMRQAPDQLAVAAEWLGLSPKERDLVSHLGRGQALWKIGSRSAVCLHSIAAGEIEICDTDARMRAGS